MRIEDVLNEYLMAKVTTVYLPTPIVQKSGDVLKSLHCENVINLRQYPGTTPKNHPKGIPRDREI